MSGAKVYVFETIAGECGLHDETGWDALPFWKYYKAYIVAVEVVGNLQWGPCKHRQAALREHSGVARVDFRIARSFVAYNADTPGETREDCKAKAEEAALNYAIELEKKGFTVDIIFLKDETSRSLDREYVRFVDALPPVRFIKRIKEEARLKMLSP